MIKPTVGRVVLYKPHASERFAGDDGSKRWPAIITNVWGDTCVNLTVFDPNGTAIGGRCSVMLAQDDQVPMEGWCEWMPFQKGQAAAQDAAAKLASG